MLLVFILSAFSSCTILVDSIGASIAGSTYPNEDSDMLAAEAAYCALEDELRDYLDTYQETHDYDVYRFDLDEIEHDPYVLISILSAFHGGMFTADEVQEELKELFQKQYILTETVESETRYRTETQTETRTVTDPETG